MSALPLILQEIRENQREEEWRQEDVSKSDIQLSGLSGVDAKAVRAFRELTRRGLLPETCFVRSIRLAGELSFAGQSGAQGRRSFPRFPRWAGGVFAKPNGLFGVLHQKLPILAL